MTAYRSFAQPQHAKSGQEAKAASDAAKAKRQAVLTRVRKQRAQTYQRTPAGETLEENSL